MKLKHSPMVPKGPANAGPEAPMAKNMCSDAELMQGHKKLGSAEAMEACCEDEMEDED